ncbi:hypothetical protein ACEWY4_006691 [Coilia grayii]|uniref:Uncharacterized protein n=1 Tax=Coilia grayii TaxID=363190 RepID=A0ABD1KE66_9TELE
MAYFMLVALLVASGVTAYPNSWQQRPRGRPRDGQYAGGPAAGSGGDFWVQDRPRPPFGFEPMDGGQFMPRPNGGGRPRPGPGGNGGYFPRPGGPNMPDWGMDEPQQPWFPAGPTEVPEGEDQGNGGWPNGNDEFEEPTDFPDRGDKWGQGSWRQRQAEWGPGVRRTQGGMGPNRRNPNTRRPEGPDGRFPFGGRPVPPSTMPNRQFTPILKLDNVTLPNITGMPLKEGENIFLLPMARHNAPQEMRYGYPSYGPQPYIKLIYNPTATQKISFEYGITQLLPSFLKADPEEDGNGDNNGE